MARIASTSFTHLDPHCRTNLETNNNHPFHHGRSPTICFRFDATDYFSPSRVGENDAIAIATMTMIMTLLELRRQATFFCDSRFYERGSSRMRSWH